jgi:hypothetical protein
MTDTLIRSDAGEPPPEGGRKVGVATVVALLLALGIGAGLVIWLRRGGARRVLTELVEEGAVKLADALLDEVLPAA